MTVQLTDHDLTAYTVSAETRRRRRVEPSLNRFCADGYRALVANSDDQGGVFTYDVALSFAGQQRAYVESVAAALRRKGIRTFYDDYETAALWGKDLYEHLDRIYQKEARYCVLFASEDYAKKVWPTHERRSAQARALLSKEEYILPVRFDDTEIPGLRPTVAYADARSLAPAKVADLISEKLGHRIHAKCFPPEPDKLFAATSASSPGGRYAVKHVAENASTAAASPRNHHGVALVSLEAWEYNSPWVKASGKRTDLGLLAMALVYYDQVVVELQHPQQLRDIVEWAVRTGRIGQVIGLIKDGTLRFHHHAFFTSAVNIDGVFSVWNLQESDTTVDRFMEIAVQSADLSMLPARHRSALLQAIRQHTDISVADDYGPPVEDARRALHDEATSNALLQAVVDDLYPRRGIRHAPNVACRIEYVAADSWKIFWEPDLNEITRLVGGGLDYRPDIPLIGEAISNRLMWTAANRQCDLVLGDVMSTVTGQKLAEVGRREGKVGEILYELQATVDLPDIRTLGNSDALQFDEVLRVRKHATRFRKWLQERGEKDSPSFVAYLNDVAEASGFRKTGGTTIQVLGYGAELVAAPIFAATRTGGAALAAAIGAPVSGEFLKYLGTRIKSTWRPIVFGNFLKRELGTRKRD